MVKILDKSLYNKWWSITKRCTDIKHQSYYLYGAKGVSVCEDWKEYSKFKNWSDSNSIPGWEIDKDILSTGTGQPSKSYSPETCCYVPPYINQWFARTFKIPKLQKRWSTEMYRMSISEKVSGTKKRWYITSNTPEGVYDQYYAHKDRHIKALRERLINDWDEMSAEIPNLPPINTEMLNVLENFSTKKHILTYTEL